MDGRLGIGIDTGGTYTDAVIYDFSAKKLVAAAKALTTRQDLSVGILEALSALPDDLLQQARLISLSTTLATNACVEDSGGRARLIFLGGDKKVINDLGAKYGLPPADEIYVQESYSTFYGKIERDPDWDLFRKSIAEQFNHLDGAGIIEIYAMKNNAVLEKKAREIFEELHSIPVVCGHELFSDLNCLQRAAGTLLNARLFPVIREFLEAISKAAASKKIDARTVIVRSDGSLMSAAHAGLRPVETLLCGPAATVSGGIFLSGEKDAVIIDMGGTTTDIALVRNGNPVIAADGISMGKWKTFVKGFGVRTFGLGGDSAVHFNEKRLILEERRVVPLCVAASKYPAVIEKLRELAEAHTQHSLFLHEHFLLGSGIKDSARYTDTEKRLCEILERGPLILREAAAAMDTDIYNFNPSRLLAEGIVQMAGFTPTDVMHLKNDFSAFSKEASLLAARHIALNMGITVDDLCGLVYGEVKRKLYFNIARTLLENRDKNFEKKASPEGIEYFICQNYESAKVGNAEADKVQVGNANTVVALNLHTPLPLVGLGAPIRIFLGDVARLFGTRAVIPDHYEVANALGAVAGKIRASYTVEIKPDYYRDGIAGYTVYGCNQNGSFRKLSEAEAFAAAEAEAGASSEIRSRGGLGDLELAFEYAKHEGSAKNGSIYMGSSVTAHASASAGIDG
jgi:N-methylhydantoinase A/oxoprolinase/acetone carboxylase beta subunit